MNRQVTIKKVAAATSGAQTRALPIARPIRTGKPDAVPVDVVEAPRRWLTPARIGFAFVAIAIYLGWTLPTERLLSPERGIGYALGIAGGSAMLLLLLYPARKRMRRLGFLGTVKGWFQLHMVLGVVGPLLILYHSNFSLGATNSNAALISMLLVAGSGIFGRYFYTRIHHGLYGRRATHAELQKAAGELREKVAGSRFVPELLEQIDAAEQRLLRRPAGSAAHLLQPLRVTGRMLLERWQLTRFARQRLRVAADSNPVLAAQHRKFETAIRRYIGKRLEATRRLAEFQSYERLFSLWHVLHLPLFLLLLIAGVVHVVAVHVY
jgi:hypothetical protein